MDGGKFSQGCYIKCETSKVSMSSLQSMTIMFQKEKIVCAKTLGWKELGNYFSILVLTLPRR